MSHCRVMEGLKVMKARVLLGTAESSGPNE